MLRPSILPVALLLAAAACSAPPAAGPTDGNAPPAGSAASESGRVEPLPAPPASGASSSAAPAASPSAAAPAGSAAPAAPEGAVAPAASASAAAEAGPAAPEEPLPSVKVSNIGMHIGGGPNDAVTKEPIRRSVEPHFDAFRRCYAKAEGPKKAGDFGIDLRIERAGGKAQVSHPRTAIKGNDFKACVVRVFEGIDFLKPKGGKTVVSYSLRFTP